MALACKTSRRGILNDRQDVARKLGRLCLATRMRSTAPAGSKLPSFYRAPNEVPAAWEAAKEPRRLSEDSVAVIWRGFGRDFRPAFRPQGSGVVPSGRLRLAGTASPKH
jgi:hypothetical protein